MEIKNIKKSFLLNDFQSFPKQQKIPIRGFCINLERRPDRWEAFKQAKPSEIKIMRFNAVDAKNFKEYMLKNPMDFLESKIGFDCDNTNNSPGVVGCFLSHYRLWKLIAKSTEFHDDELIYIFEDDANFVDNWFEKISSYMIGLSFTPNLLYIGGRFSPNFNVPEK